MKVYQSIAKTLTELTAAPLFGLVGDGNLYLVHSFVKDMQGVFIDAANEAGAVLMALGYSFTSGEVGIATVTHGPGLTNCVTGLVEGVRASLPMVLICGDTPLLERDALQKLQQRELVAATGAGFEQLRGPQTIAQDFSRAWSRAVVERRPIVVNVPVEFQWMDVVHETPRLRIAEAPRVPAAGQDLDDAIGIVAMAKRPLILAGRGAATPEARDALIRLGDRLDAPLATTLKAKGLFRGHPFDIGIFGTLSSEVTLEVIGECDCIIAFGASLNRYTTADLGLLRGKRIVQVNDSGADIGRHAGSDVGVVGGAVSTADLIVHWLDEAEIAPSRFRNDEMRRRLAGRIEGGGPGIQPAAGTVNYRNALKRLNKLIPGNRMLITDGGRFQFEAWRFIDVEGPHAFYHTINFASIGLGLAHAIGAGFGATDRPLLVVTGDGGFMLGGLVEFNTAVRHQTDLIVVVCNDSAYGFEHYFLKQKGLDIGVSLCNWPDLGPVAESLGGSGITIRSEADLDLLEESILNRRSPLLIDLKVDPECVPAG